MPTRTGYAFIAGIWVVGALTGLVLGRAPATIPHWVPTPALTVPLVAGFIVDIALRPATERGRIFPLTMNERAIGVIGAALIAAGASALVHPG